MSNILRKSYLRLEDEPRAVNGGNIRVKPRYYSRWHQDNDDRQKPLRRRSETHRASQTHGNLRRRSSHTSPGAAPVERPYFTIDMIGQPAKNIQLGVAVEVSAMVNVELPSFKPTVGVTGTDTHSLFAVASLVAESQQGERLALEAGSLTGPKMFDSIHPISEDRLDLSPQSQPCRTVLGYVTFPCLSIRQVGTYRLRLTLIQMGDTATAGATSLLSVDSEPIKVERRGNCSQRRRQQVYG